MDLSACRSEFPALERRFDELPLVYLDNAATTLKPLSVIQALSGFYATNGATVHRGRHFLSEEASGLYEGVRTQVAQFIGACSDEIVFVRNTTEALNMVASGLSLDSRDIVVGCLDSHHSQILPWRRKADLRLVRITDTGRIDLDHFHELLRLRPKVVALTHCSNVTGAIAPIAEMAAIARQACDPIVVVDAAQSIPHRSLDVMSLDIDFLAFSAHKMLGPTGVGCLFGRRGALERLKPMLTGGGTVDWVGADDVRPRKVPHRFEAGTPAIGATVAFGAALNWLQRARAGAHLEHEQALTRALVEGACAREYLSLLGPRDFANRLPIVSVRVAGCDDLTDFARSLSDSKSIMCRTGRLCAQPLVDAHARAEVLRASAYVYNSVAEIDALFEALDELVQFFGR